MTGRPCRRALGLVLGAVVAIAPAIASALPMYALRSGRTCGNCHVSPTVEDKKGWDNPSLSKRKCNMSCVACHVNPGGGGLRNTSGRYYGQSTVALMPFQERSYHDNNRELLPSNLIHWIKRSTGPDGRGKTPTDGRRTVPSSFDDVKAGMGKGKRGGWSNGYKPLLSPSEYAFWDGRYADLNADPLLVIGADLRAAYWSGSGTVFPMQMDLHAALHPVEHLTVMATAAARGRSSGYLATVTQDQLPVFARNAFVMVHELPMMAYAKAGIFLPTFGTYIDDHTSFNRQFFEMDLSQSHDTALGVEVGLSPNYPFASVSVFRNFLPPDAPDGTGPGFGAAFNLGWRDLAWSATAHGMIKRRDLAARGDMEAIGLGWGFSPFALSDAIPLVYMGEFTIGRRQRAITGGNATVWALYQELWWTVFNGIVVRAKHDLGTRDADDPDGLEQRVSLMLDVGVVPGVTLSVAPRILWSGARAGPEADVLVQTHLWF